MMLRWCLSLILLSVPLIDSGQIFPNDPDPDPFELLEIVKSKFSVIHDFSADVEIDVQFDFINIPKKYARVLYKNPDKLRFRSNSFLLVPKKGIGIKIFEVLNGAYSAIYIGRKLINGRELSEVKVVPLSDDEDITLATLFIDPTDYLIYRLEATTRESGFFKTDFEYGDHAPLPEINTISFEVDRIGVPLKFLGKVDIDRSKLESGSEGEVIIRFYNYEINKGLDAAIFEENNNDTNYID